MATDIILLDRVYATASTAANTNILTADLDMNTSSRRGVTTLRVQFAHATAGAVAAVFNVRTTDGTTARTFGIAESVARNSGDLYSYDILVDPNLDYNFQFETATIVQQLVVYGIKGAST